tara:strand:- start:31 stop:237 length:207 start_codon:yes stop_codon:yes gene_type:complete
MSKDIKYPNITVQLTGEDGNVMSIIGRCRREMRNAKCTPEQIDEFTNEMMSGDYDNALQTCIGYFNVE